MKRPVVYVLLATAVTAAFLLGQRLGARSTHLLRLPGQILSADAGPGGAFGLHGLTLGGQALNVPPQDTFESVLDHIHHDYVRDDGGDRRLSNGALAGMLASLNDPMTQFLDPNMSAARQHEITGHYGGIGAALVVTQSKQDDIDYRYLTAMSVMPGSPAAAAGIRPGDHITNVDGHWIIAYSIQADVDRIHKKYPTDDAAFQTAIKPVVERFTDGYPASKAIKLLTAGIGKTYMLTIARGGVVKQKKVTTAATEVSPVEYHVLPNDVGLLAIRSFDSEATSQFEHAIGQARSDRALILDLRENPGGVAAADHSLDGYSSARKLISLLSPGGPIATIETKPGQRKAETISASPGALKKPLVVLVDGGTSNLAEMVAASLRDRAGARLVGDRTFGDDVLQLFATLKDGSALEIATAHLLTASGADLAGGLQPDVPLSPDIVDTDAAVQRALQVVHA